MSDRAAKEIVWIYGASAAGKETFIRKVLADETLAGRFGWRDKRVGACEESMEWVAHHPDDETRKQRYKLLGIIPKLAKELDVVLVKGQDFDLGLGTPLRVKQALPDSTHRIIFIDVELDELFRRVVQKPWWNDSIKRAEEEGWLEEQIDRLEEIKNQFEFTAVNGNVADHYETQNFDGNFV